MPKVYEYFGLYIYFYAREHFPIHVHVEYEDRMCKVELTINDGKVKQYEIVQIGKNPMMRDVEIRNLKALLKYYSNDIIKKWEAFHIEKRKIKAIKITKRLK